MADSVKQCIEQIYWSESGFLDSLIGYFVGLIQF